MTTVLASGADVVKLSHEELIADGWSEHSSVDAIADGIERLHAAGADSVVVSRKDRSTIAGARGWILEVRSPGLEVLDGRGGDSIEDIASRVEIRTLRDRSAASPTSAKPREANPATKGKLYERARQLDIRGRSTMSRQQLIEAIDALDERAARPE